LSNYLEQLSKPAAASTAAPFFFTDGASDLPMSAGSSAKNTADYMSALTGAGKSAPSGAGITSYLDALKGPAVSARGAGMTSYLDALPKSSAPTGSGMPSYAASLNKAGASSAPAPVASPAAPTSFASADTSTVVISSASYLDNLKGASAPTGSGMIGYLDALPQGPRAITGAGILSYANALRTTNTVSGAGIRSYTDALSPTSGSWKGASSSSSGSPAAFTIGSVSGRFDFSLEVDADIIEKLKQAGNRKVTLTGKVTNVAF
jgi:hypothetical protein